MAYRFKLNESLTRGVRRIASSQLEQAERHLSGGCDPAAAVHEARKSIKRVRALLRLVRSAVGDSVYHRENGDLRDAGRLLSPARDRHVMLVTLSKLETRLSANRRAIVGQLRDLLAASDGPGENASEERRDVDAAKATLAASRKRLARVSAGSDGFDALGVGLHASHRSGRRALRRALERSEDEDFHELRKSVQLHWRQMLLLSRAWPQVCRARAGAAREIAQLLGEEHDYAVVTAFAGSRRGNGVSDEDLDVVEQACRARQVELRETAVPMARRLFAGSSRRFTQQMSVCWEVAGDLARLEKRRQRQVHEKSKMTKATKKLRGSTDC